MEHDEPTFSKTHYRFYSTYSRFTLKALKRYPFQKFLYFMLESEKIAEEMIDSVRIIPYPAPRKNGSTIAGKCNTHSGRIRIYPKTMNFCYALRKKYGKDIFVAYAGNRARASLIHELLHLKYISDEAKVRTLTEKYFSKYIAQYTKSSSSLVVLNLIFAQ